MPHGETGESSVDLIPFQVIDVLPVLLILNFWTFEFEEISVHRVDYFVFNDGLCWSGFVT